MSFIDTAAELLDRTEASLQGLISDALKAKAYREVATIAAMAESLAALTPGRPREGKRAAADVGAAATTATETTKATEPSWMWPKNP